MKYLVFIPTILLSGCFYQSVDQFDIQRAIVYCGGVEKVVSIDSDALGVEHAKCIKKPMRSLTGVTLDE